MSRAPTRTASPRTAPTEDPGTRRWVLIRDLLVFSAKAALEALRDIVLIPLALLTGVAGLLGSRNDPERPFREMLGLGRRFDDWLNLFGPIEDERPRRREGETVDAWFARLESIVVEQHDRGGITASAKAAIDRALDGVQPGHRSGSGREGGGRNLEEG